MHIHTAVTLMYIYVAAFINNSKHFYLDSHIPLFCFSFSLWSLRFLLRPCYKFFV